MKDWQGSEGNEALLVEGIVVGTRIATQAGWRGVETLRPGDAVLTLEAGFQPLARAFRVRLPAGAPEAIWPLAVPTGALDCREPLLLLPDQKVLIECDQAELLYGDALALVPAAALEGWRSISRVPHRTGAEAVILGFPLPQIVYASRAVLLACPGQADATERPADLLAGHAPGLRDAALSLAQARHLITCLIAEDLGGALRS